MLSLWPQDLQFTSSSKDSPNAGFKPSGEEEKKDVKDPGNKDNEVPSTEEPRVNQEKDANINNTNNINTVSPTVNAAGIEDNAVDENIVYGCVDDPNMPNLKEIVYSDDDEDVDIEADMTNMDTHIPVSPILSTRIHKDHPVEQIIGDIHSATQTRRMTKSVTKHGEVNCVNIQQIIHKGWLKWNVTTAEDRIEVKTGNSQVNAVGHYLVLLGEKALKFADSHNMVAYLDKSTENANFDEIVDFLNANPIRYALTIFNSLADI
ncbi:hypothetical protein Tco_1544506, partial [Tanacetum coccineum]